MRMISYSMTEPQFMDGSKDVTRRLGWANLKPGQLLRGVRKAMGLKKGEKVHTLGIIRVVDVRRERLDAILSEPNGAAREGFPELTQQQFVDMFCRHHSGCRPDTVITRIQFVHVAVPRPSDGELSPSDQASDRLIKVKDDSMTDTATKSTTRRPAKPLEEQEHAPKPPKGKAAQRKRGKRTPEQEAADKAKKAELEGKTEKPPKEQLTATVEDVTVPGDPAGETLAAEQATAADKAKQHIPPEQTTFEGPGFPEGPPREVCKARDEYLGAMRSSAEAAKHKGSRKERLIEVMREHGVSRINLDGENKFFELETEFKIKTKTTPKDQRDNPDRDEEL